MRRVIIELIVEIIKLDYSMHIISLTLNAKRDSLTQ